MQIIGNEGLQLTFAIPPGQRIFLNHDSLLVDQSASSNNTDAADHATTDYTNGVTFKSLPSSNLISIDTSGPTANILTACNEPDHDCVEPSVKATNDAENDSKIISGAAAVVADASSNDRNIEEDAATPEVAESPRDFNTVGDRLHDLESNKNVSSKSPRREIPESLNGAGDDITLVPSPAGNHASVEIADSFDQSSDMNTSTSANGDTVTPNEKQHQKGPQLQNSVHSAEYPTIPDSQEPGSAPLPEATMFPGNEQELDSGPKPAVSAANPGISTGEIILDRVTGPGRLSGKIIEIDGRISHVPHGNAWKSFRCYRDNQDIGSLWEVRQAWYLRRK